MSKKSSNAAFAGTIIIAAVLATAITPPALARGNGGQSGQSGPGGGSNGDGNAPAIVLTRVPPREQVRVHRTVEDCSDSLLTLLAGAPRCAVNR